MYRGRFLSPTDDHDLTAEYTTGFICLVDGELSAAQDVLTVGGEISGEGSLNGDRDRIRRRLRGRGRGS